jgi:hypothetical protein
MIRGRNGIAGLGGGRGGRALRLLCAPRPLWLLLTIALVIGVAWTLPLLPWGFIAGASDFWTYPSGAFGPTGNSDDMVQVEAGALALAETPWTLPLLYTPLLGAPEGTNIFWMDAVPWLSLLRRVIHSLTGGTVNLIGLFIFACFALPGVAMAGLLAAAGARGLIAVAAGALIADATPALLFGWGHVPHSAHAWIIVALVLYLLQVRRSRGARLAAAWTAVLPFVLLTNVYLFAMCAACWAAALAQRLLDRTISIARAGAECAAVAGVIVLVMAVTGILSPTLGQAGSEGFGYWSMNVLSPVLPQMSGLIPRLRNFRIGMGGQYEGFAWLGGGVLFLGVASARAWGRWLRARARAHGVLLAVFALFLAFALSNRVWFGSDLVLDVELPARVLNLLGTFRASGRFFWPLGYAFAAGSIVLTLRTYRPAIGMALLAVAALLQAIDVTPLRAVIAASAAHPGAPRLDRAATAALIARAREVRLYPSYDCAQRFAMPTVETRRAVEQILALNMEFQLLAVRQAVPINAVYTARPLRSCAAELAEMRERLVPGILYVWLIDYRPTPEQLGNGALVSECATAPNLRWCLLPD